MIITIGSGKGGTGKTTVAVSLAMSFARRRVAVQFLDCDVEEPNAHLFLQTEIDTQEKVKVEVPVIDHSLCTRCGACAQFCQFNALAALPQKVLVFPELCHSCGGCMRVCPAGAIGKVRREVGEISLGMVGEIQFGMGRINIGEARATPVISKLKENINRTRDCIIDAPAGTSCPFVETVKGSDVCLMVAEPTPFGLNDLKLAVDVVERLGIPHAVVINRSDLGDEGVMKFCQDKGIAILMMIPHDRSIAEAYAVGRTLIDVKPEYEGKLFELREELHGQD